MRPAEAVPDPGPADYLRLVALAAAIGIPAALVAALFLALIHELEDWLWDDLPDGLGYASPPWFLVIGLPVAGALIVVIARRFLPGDGGHSPREGLSVSADARQRTRRASCSPRSARSASAPCWGPRRR